MASPATPPLPTPELSGKKSDEGEMMSPVAPAVAITREIRFAVVMYGGVSLAIYINGIAQELLSLVRSTGETGASGSRVALSSVEVNGPNDPDKKAKLSGTERVYRKLSYLLTDSALLEQYRETFEPADEGQPGRVKETSDLLDDYLLRAKPEPITTSFVIDILSGTSAGGINAIFLAKALANDQSIDRLKHLWIEEGNIDVLLNDKTSVRGVHLVNQDPPKSLLNGRRLYLKLLQAFDEMDAAKENKTKGNSPYVKELDLFVTTTDIKGVTFPLQLSDKVVYERRYKNVFHFKYGTEEAFGQNCSHFGHQYNPFLAFAARCTSSFPFAFEPMRLCELDDLLDAYGDPFHRAGGGSESDLWKPFFDENIDPRAENNGNGQGAGISKLKIDAKKRSFGDGGYLDNKPFSYATETLSHRQSIFPVERKLIYIEPSPEHPEDERDSDTPPDALLNAKAALIDLPGYETIREDLQRVLQRNRLIQRVVRIVDETTKDLDQVGSGNQRKNDPYDLRSHQWRIMDMSLMVEYCGIYYLPYRRLRIASVTDDLTELVARINSLDENSASFIAVRTLLRVWRQKQYVSYYNSDEASLARQSLADPEVRVEIKAKTYNAFLDDFDFSYRFRRLNFVLGKIDILTRLAAQLPRLVTQNATDGPELSTDEKELVRILRECSLNDSTPEATENAIKDILSILAYLKCELTEVHKALRIAVRKLQSKPKAPTSSSESAPAKRLHTLLPVGFSSAIADFQKAISDLKLDPKQLNFLLGLGEMTLSGEITVANNDCEGFTKLDDEESARRAAQLYDGELKGHLDGAAEQLRTLLRDMIVGPTSARSALLLNPDQVCPDPLSEGARQRANSSATKLIRSYLQEFYAHFDRYDQILFPILYETDFGESAEVDVFRISPEDAPSLINERGPKADGRQKLAGNALFHFGAFLDRVWRENDIMWGRLDGAERLITALLPDQKYMAVRNKLISEAHWAILSEEMPPQTREDLGKKLAEALIRASSGETFEQAIAKVVGPLTEPKIKSRLQTIMYGCFLDKELLTFVKQHYEVNRHLEPKDVLRYAARATQIIGKVLDDIAQSHKVESKSLLWIARLGQIFWGLVEVAVPGSIANLLLFHWVKLLYVLEILLIASTFLLGGPDLKRFAWTAFGLTFVVNIIVLLLRDFMRGKKVWLRVGYVVLGIALLFFSAIGVTEIFYPKINQWIFSQAGFIAAWFSKLFT